MSTKDDLVKRVEKALENNARKQLPKEPRGTRAKRGAPEKEVEKIVLKWLRKQGFSVDVISNEIVQRVTRGAGANTFDNSPTRPGFSDIVGNDRDGRAVFIELKAPGRLRNLSYSQACFIEEKIETGAFACVTDKVERLADIYKVWSEMTTKGACKRSKDFLRSCLPKTSEQVMHGADRPENPDIPF